MRWRPLLWMMLSLLLFLGAAWFWRLGDKWAADKAAARKTNQPAATQPSGRALLPAPIRLLSGPGLLNAKAPLVVGTNRTANARFAYRLANTPKTIDELARQDAAILLENALLDTTLGTDLQIPEHLRAKGDPGSYIVQSRTAPDNAFRMRLSAAGAEIVSYIPNNAYLVRASAAAASDLRGQSQIQAVIPYEPYYKLKGALLRGAVEQFSLADDAQLNVLLFEDAREATLKELDRLGIAIVGEEASGIGPILRVRPPPDGLAALAGLSGVQIVELSQPRVLANDLSRVRDGVSSDTQVQTNYFGLTGTNILINLNDTSVDTNHPDLVGRVSFDVAAGPLDTEGHGTHVAGIIAGDGTKSSTVTNATGSIMPGTNNQFRGIAPGARLLSLPLQAPDAYLQETAARTNATISNNSWGYNDNDYNLASASYDAAVRDALPRVTGSQPVTFVFSAGNAGALSGVPSGAFDGGTGGDPDSIRSPGTAKNVITVGAIEQSRSITNQVTSLARTTNQPWLGLTDSSNQVAGFSSRGNVGIGLEGKAGRFKPDVVAPGTFVVSTRSKDWDEIAYYNNTNYSFGTFPGIVLRTNSVFGNGVFVPENAVELVIAVFGVDPPGSDLVIYVTPPPGGAPTFAGPSPVVVSGGALTPANDFWFYTVSNASAQTVTFNVFDELVTTNDSGNYFEVLSNMNNTLSQPENGKYYYRYESGTSMAAGDVSGMLALMKEFFEQRLTPGRTNSPALMKALLINGARSVGDTYDFQVNSGINYQGWGLVNLPTTLHGGLATPSTETNSMFIFEQNPTDALATGQSTTRKFELTSDAQNQPLKVTVVWTDPPGNPAASIKLVNDLDVIVTNLDTGEVFFGNDILAGNDFNLAWNTNNAPTNDIVNNVENVFLKAPLGTNYSVTVVGRRVNVNAVTAHTNNVVQDYALVISSGDGAVTNAMRLVSTVGTSVNEPLVTLITNSFPSNADEPTTGGLLLRQHVGANTPLSGTNSLALTNDANARLTIGMTNQWHFYVISNDNNFTNAAFVTFLPPDLALPRMGTREFDLNNATRLEADIDLYVSTEPGLTNLDPNVIARADKSVGRGGTEFIVYSNAGPRAVYYIGVKSEDQMAAEYSLLGVFSQFPFGSTDTNGNAYLRGVPVPQAIPVGTPPNPQAAQILCININEMKVRRVVVTNTMTHQLPGNLLGNLSHNRKFAVLNNHTCAQQVSGDCITNRFEYIYEDNGEGFIPGVRHSDGPGSLRDFIGEDGLGVWLLTMVNNFPAGTGEVDRLSIKLERENLDPDSAAVRTLLPKTWTFDSIDVPPEATNLTVCVAGNTQPVVTYIKKGSLPTVTDYDYFLTNNPPGDCLSITPYDLPPLTPGRYFIGVFNQSDFPQDIRVFAFLGLNIGVIPRTLTSVTGHVPILDDAVTTVCLTNNTHLLISSLDVGVLINHPRISDLVMTLVAPDGTRVLLFENRGALSTNGLGTFSVATNAAGTPVFAVTNMTRYFTNDFERAAVGLYAPSSIFQDWRVLSNFVAVAPDVSVIWHSNNLLVLGTGVVSNSLPTTNSTAYQLSYRVTHAPYLFGTVGWWPFDGDGSDIYGGFDGLLSGDVTFMAGEIFEGFRGDGLATRMVVPRCPDLDLGNRQGFTIEGWVRPNNLVTNVVQGVTVMSNSLESPVNLVIPAPAYIANGWHVDAGDVDTVAQGVYGTGPMDSGLVSLDINGYQPGTMSTNVALVAGRTYRLIFAFARNPDCPTNVTPRMQASVGGTVLLALNATLFNSWNDFRWTTTSAVFTAASPISKLEMKGLSQGASGVHLDSIRIVEQQFVTNIDYSPAPVVEWNDPTNVSPQGVQFWTGPSNSLTATVWGTNGVPHTVSTPPLVLTNDGWQHVAFSYDTNSHIARFYTNGFLCAALPVSTTNFAVRTTGDLYFGYHPARSTTNTAAFKGGLDEFGLYERVLSDCEIALIAGVTNRGKYGTNVLLCPVTNAVQLTTTANQVFTFTNGIRWTNTGLTWETNTIFFTNLFQSASTNGGPGTNVTPLIVRALDPNAAVDDFILSALLTNYIDGLLHFTENTNLAQVPIKFAPWPYLVTNFPPTLIFSNDFSIATQGVYQAGDIILGNPNNPAQGPRDWRVAKGRVTVITNSELGSVGSNVLALARGAVECPLPTIAGRRYTLTYMVHGPCAVGWWNGDADWQNQRAQDAIGGNDGQLWYGATSAAGRGLVTSPQRRSAMFFPGMHDASNNIASRIELGDPDNLKFTNSFTIEGWFKPLTQTNDFINSVLGSGAAVFQQLVFRGDLRHCLDPYYLTLEQVTPDQFDLEFHIENATARDCGMALESERDAIVIDQWNHIAAVFEAKVHWTNGPAWPTNELRLYLNGNRLTNVFVESSSGAEIVGGGLTGRAPFRDLDPAFGPGVTIGDRRRYDAFDPASGPLDDAALAGVAQPFFGYMDDLAIYGRALTGPEIAAIAGAGAGGKADLAAPVAKSLAKVRASLDNTPVDIGYGDNSQWVTRSVSFTALRTNLMLNLEGLLPGTLIDQVTLTELPAELNYLPEQSLDVLNGKDGFGTWCLEILDNRAGASNNAELVEFQVDFRLVPSNAPPVITLEHGVPYTNTLAAGGVQNFIVPIPQWATNATNVVLNAREFRTGVPSTVGVLFDQTNEYPASIINALFWPPVGPGAPLLNPTNILSTNSASLPMLAVGPQYYFLTVTNPHPVGVTFGLGVWFDIAPLTNCVPASNFVSVAGIPRYFQFDVPTNALLPDTEVQQVSFWLTGARSNLTVVLSQNLPLPDLRHYDYIGNQPSTNDEIVMLLTNTSPFSLQTNRWYVGVFGTAATNIPFHVQFCYSTNYPTIIHLTNGIPYVAAFTNQFVAPPGPPRKFYFEFDITNDVDAVLFEMYNLSGDADLVLQQDIPPTMATYFDGSFRVGLTPEQIVLRPSFALPDLRRQWFLGIYNNETTNVAYTIRAVTAANGLLISAQPIRATLGLLPSPHGLLLGWNSVMGERYFVQFATNLVVPVNWATIASIVATTPLTTFEVSSAGAGFYRVVQVLGQTPVIPPLTIQPWPGGLLRISWSINFPGLTLQYATAFAGPWIDANLPVTIEGNEFVVYDSIGSVPKYYRLVP